MLKVILLAILMVSVLSIGSSRNSLAVSLDLSQFQWKNRLLFIFSPSRDHPLFHTLHQSLLSQEAEVKDRDLIIFEILDSGPSNMNKNDLDPQTAQLLREKFDISTGKFTVILVGKDGGVKLKRQTQTQLGDIFALIDSMPMRQDEMRQKTRQPKS